MQMFKHHSARATCEHIRGNIKQMLVTYSGPISLFAFEELAGRVLWATNGADALMVRVDGCVLLMDQPAADSGAAHAPHAPPACIIVRPEQAAYWTAYAALLAASGIRRVVFLDSQLELAAEWLQRQSSRARR